ncbi:DUF5050 domain-containing protein [Saccharibacillus alkalitolerans]|uniref:DUF5050 domain-containing protein n=1 Tax=Saccharibacillus alkalitolerans TaxID=2705290 RepID=A0ABX0FD54_9BACL|nr:DUF5050 domain-containing protein [Saccharibacillus alkalitolerans]NGZ77583.1 DUF5050 domain-containing protein [Saccharibacillus alkalitolerans]
MTIGWKWTKRLAVSAAAAVLITAGAAASAAPSAEAAAAQKADIYYVSNGDLYRVNTEGGASQRLRRNFDGIELKPAGGYMYYMYDENSTTLLRLSLTDSGAKAADFGKSKRIVHFDTAGDTVYAMDDYGVLYATPADAAQLTDGVKLTDMADPKFPAFKIVGDRIYFNALKDGRTTWVASKKTDGSGSVQWVAKGTLDNAYYAHTDSSRLYLMVNTNPKETRYSTDCMVLYSLPKKGGAAKALNAKSPLDANAVNSGGWANGYYVFNKGIRPGSDGRSDYSTGVGYVISGTTGKTTKLHGTGVYEIANVGSSSLAFNDAKGSAYVATLANGKVTKTKKLSLSGVGYVRNLTNQGAVRSTVLFAGSGAYVLDPAKLTLKKMVGVEWDLCQYEDDVAGIFYVNAADGGRLYRMNETGTKGVKLTDEKVSRIVLIAKN